jgi:hypothetical protein
MLLQGAAFPTLLRCVNRHSTNIFSNSASQYVRLFRAVRMMHS